MNFGDSFGDFVHICIQLNGLLLKDEQVSGLKGIRSMNESYLYNNNNNNLN